MVLRPWSALATLATGFIFLGASFAHADTSADPAQPLPVLQAQAQPDEPPGGLESITVTARKREEDLQTTPVSVTAITGDALEKQSAIDFQDIALQTPSLRWEPVPSVGGAATITMRGLQQTDILPTIDPSVGVYIDGIYTARTVGMNGHLLDLERVEALKGPQGTLYGKNTLGGALNILSRRPDGTFGGWGRVRLGSDDQRDFEGAVQFPILGETLSARIAVQSLHKVSSDGTK